MLLKILAWFLAVLGLFLFASAVALALSPQPEFTDRVTKAAPLATSVGILLSLSGLLFSRADTAKNTEEKRSLFYLESARLAYEEAYALLKDGNVDRASWIAAARSVGHAQSLSSKVHNKEHSEVMELHRLKYRKLFHELLTSKSVESFYGADSPGLSLDNAAAAASAPEMRGGVHIASTVKEIPEEAIYAIWDAAKFPPSYKDPIEGRKFNEAEKASISLLFPVLSSHLEHRAKYWSSAGKIHLRKDI